MVIVAFFAMSAYGNSFSRTAFGTRRAYLSNYHVHRLVLGWRRRRADVFHSAKDFVELLVGVAGFRGFGGHGSISSAVGSSGGSTSPQQATTEGLPGRPPHG